MFKLQSQNPYMPIAAVQQSNFSHFVVQSHSFYAMKSSILACKMAAIGTQGVSC